ncbi:MAG: ATP-binding protein [Pilosibacter sp.]
MALLYALQANCSACPKHFTLHAFTVDLGFGIQDFSGIKTFCDGFQVPLTIIPTEIGKIVFETRKESNPCSLCAKMRKGALNLEAKAAGCNKIAYAHHKDDIIETMLLSLMFEGRFYTFPPKTFLDRTELTVIRPLMYVSEADVIGFKNKYNLPVCKNPCPADGHTKREYVKNLTKQLNKDNPGIKERLFHAVISGNIEGWNSGNIGMTGTSEEVDDKACRSETSAKMPQRLRPCVEEQLSRSHNCPENDRESKNRARNSDGHTLLYHEQKDIENIKKSSGTAEGTPFFLVPIFSAESRQARPQEPGLPTHGSRIFLVLKAANSAPLISVHTATADLKS